MKSFIKYDRHDEEWDLCLNDKDKKRKAESWMMDGTLDKWRHERILKLLKPFLRDKSCKWLTIGDGRCGTDANYILRKGCEVHATDISDKLLRIGSEKGFIKSYGAENAENLSFDDNSYDYVLIKEAFHHLPRPWLGLYEAFRVCRKAVIIIEPSDKKGFYKYFSNIIKFLIRRRVTNHSFEPIGNYVYSINILELEKFLLRMHYTNISTNKVIDSYFPGVEYIKLDSKNFRERFLIKKLKFQILLKEIFCILKLGHSGLIVAALFKNKPSDQLKKDMEKMNWLHKDLPRNPYL